MNGIRKAQTTKLKNAKLKKFGSGSKRGNAIGAAGIRIRPSDVDDPKRVNKLAKKFDSPEAFQLFKKLAGSYQNEPSLENYLELRRQFPQVEIEVALFDGEHTINALAQDLKKHGVHPGPEGSLCFAVEGYEPAIDALSLQIIEALVTKQKIPATGPGTIELRRNAISDALANYLIIIMLEGMETKKTELLIPCSLVTLLRHQLCGTNPDVLKYLLAKQRRQNAAWIAAKRFQGDRNISVRKLAAAVGTSRSTAARWLADPEFRHSIEANRMEKRRSTWPSSGIPSAR